MKTKSSILFIIFTIFYIHPLLAKIKVVTTLTVLEYIAKQIGKDFISTESLLPGDIDPHFADARPDYILKLNKADILVYIGMDLEIGWLPKLIEQSRNPKIYTGEPGNCDVSKDILVLEKPQGSINRSMGDIHIYGNPHYWLDPVNAVIIARNIKDSLIKIDLENKAFYEENFKEFSNRIKLYTIKLNKEYNNLKNLKVAVYHREFIYFLNRFDIKEVVSLEEKPGVPPSASHLKQVIDIIKKENIKIILIAPYNNPKYAEFVSNETGAKVVIVPTNLNKQIQSYEDLIETIFKKIQISL